MDRSLPLCARGIRLLPKQPGKSRRCCCALRASESPNHDVIRDRKMELSMSRMPLIVAAEAANGAKELLDRTQMQLGRVPNLYRAMANSPAALDGYLAFRAALVAGRLNARLREQLALLIAEANGCEYCVSAHNLRGIKIGISQAELE